MPSVQLAEGASPRLPASSTRRDRAPVDRRQRRRPAGGLPARGCASPHVRGHQADYLSGGHGAGVSPRTPPPRSSRHATLDASAATHSGCDGSRDHRGLRDRRAAPGCDGGRDHRGFRDRSADDADSSDTCRSEGNGQSPTVAVAWSASIEAMIAWMGIRPLAISWPPERRAADANGAAHTFS